MRKLLTVFLLAFLWSSGASALELMPEPFKIVAAKSDWKRSPIGLLITRDDGKRILLASSHYIQAIANANSAAGGVTCAALSLSTTPSNGWSTGRKLNGSYSGSAFKLELVGLTTQDIGFGAGGCVDTAAAATFCVTTCHVIKIYDQYGSVDFTFGSFAAAAVYTASCINSKPCMDNSGIAGTGTSGANNDLAYTGNFAYAAVVLDNSGSPEGGYFGNVNGGGGGFPGLYFGPSTQVARFKLSAYFNATWSVGASSITVVDNIIHLAYISRTSTTMTIGLDGTTTTAGSAGSSVTGVAASMFGGVGGGTYTGKFSEGITFASSVGDIAGYRTSTQAFWATQ